MRPDDGRVASDFIVQALKGGDVTVCGDGSQARSFCYVDDMVDALIRLMDAPHDFTGPVNLVNPDDCSIKDLAHMIIDITDSPSKTVSAKTTLDDPAQRQPGGALARSALRWQPRVDLVNGLKETVQYFRNAYHFLNTLT